MDFSETDITHLKSKIMKDEVIFQRTNTNSTSSSPCYRKPSKNENIPYSIY